MAKSKYCEAAKTYDLFRPSYPDNLIKTIIKHSGVSKDSLLLEIGAGTGKATDQFVDNGFRIDCVEIEPSMANILINKHADNQKVKVFTHDFETWKNEPNTKYDLIYSAQAFHWLSDEEKYKKCNEMLSDKGSLTLFWYFSVIQSEVLRQGLNRVFKKYCEHYSLLSNDDCFVFASEEVIKINNSGLFKNTKEKNFKVRLVQDANTFIERFNTTSAYSSLSASSRHEINMKLAQIINKNGGEVVSDLIYILLFSKKI